MSTMTERMLGLSQGPARAPNTYPLWRYLLILGIVTLGVIYALPNLFPPDYALQIRSERSEATLDRVGAADGNVGARRSGHRGARDGGGRKEA